MPLPGFTSAPQISSAIEFPFRKSFNETVRIENRVFEQIDIWRLSAVLLVALLCYATSVLWFWGIPWEPVFTFESAELFYPQDVRVQTTFYYLFCLSTFLVFLIIGILKPYSNWIKTPAQPILKNTKKYKFEILPHQFSWLHIAGYCLFWLAIYLLSKKSIPYFILMIAIARLFEMALLGKISEKILALIFMASVALFYVLPLAMGPYIPLGVLWSMDIHWSAVFGNALYQESLSGNEISAFSVYGFISNFLVSQARYLTVFKSLAGTQNLFYLINFVFFGLVFWIIRQRITAKNNSQFWLISILVLFSFSITIAGYSPYTFAPNQLPIRFLMIPCSVLVAFYMGNLSNYKNAVANGFLAPFLLSYNFETGIFCILGLGFAMFLKCAKGGIKSVIISGVIYPIAFFISAAFLMVLILGEISSENANNLVQSVSRTISSAAGGWGGLQLRFYPSYIICMTHVFVMFAGYLLNIRNTQSLSKIDYQNAVIVGIIIATGTYMMNRFASINMWIPLLLYILLLVPKICSKVKTDKLMWPLIILLLIVPIKYTGLQWLLSGKAYTYITDRTSVQNRICFEGFAANIELCNYLNEKIQELNSLLLTYPDLQWSSGIELTISRLTGLRGAIQDHSLIFHASNTKTRSEIVNKFQNLDSKIIVIDKIQDKNPAGIPKLSEAFRLRMLNDAGYKYLSETNYWIVAEKIQK